MTQNISLGGNDKDAVAATETLRAKFVAKYEKLQSDVQEAIKPVTHTIVIEAGK